VHRGVALVGAGVIVQDEIVPGAARARVEWHLHTTAAVQLDGDRAELTQGGERLVMTILGPPGATFAQAPATPHGPPGQNPNEGVTDVTIGILVERPTTLVVAIAGAGAAPPPVVPLAQWSAR
jgi:hypothetical protein